MANLRDIDYAATAVQTAIVDKFGRQNDLQNLTATAQQATIHVRDGRRSLDGTRDNLLAAIRKATTYEELWQMVLPADV